MVTCDCIEAKGQGIDDDGCPTQTLVSTYPHCSNAAVDAQVPPDASDHDASADSSADASADATADAPRDATSDALPE
jgi:hypothetical protein